jgi:hypothetical protein
MSLFPGGERYRRILAFIAHFQPGNLPLQASYRAGKGRVTGSGKWEESPVPRRGALAVFQGTGFLRRSIFSGFFSGLQFKIFDILITCQTSEAAG